MLSTSILFIEVGTLTFSNQLLVTYFTTFAIKVASKG